MFHFGIFIASLTEKFVDGLKSVSDGVIDAAFRKVRKNSIGFHIWKVENNRVEALPKEKFGIFYDDCTYIIYASTIKGNIVNQYTISREIRPNTNVLYGFIHFWLGSNTTSDKSGNVAYKVIELDNHLENIACQYRETQEHESARFMSYFKDGIIVYSHHAQFESKAQLFQVKDKKCPRCIQRSPINWSHFKSNYVMILKTPKYLFVWIGRTSSHSERLNAFKLAAKMRAQCKQMPEMVVVDDGYEQSMTETKKKSWNEYLCLSQRVVHPSDELPTIPVPTFRLYKCGFHNGKYRIEEIKSSILHQRDLSSSRAYIIDCGPHYGAWIWVGRYSDAKDKSEAMRNARGFVKKKSYPGTTPVVRVIEGYEPYEFVRFFPWWQDFDVNGNRPANLLGKYDAMSLIQRPHLAAESQLIDDGHGEMVIYRVGAKGDIIEIPKRNNIALFSGDCYLIHYIVTSIENNGKTLAESNVKNILYLWTGKQCSVETAVQGENLADEYAKHLRNKVMQVRVYENMEPPHFLQVFKGRMIVFKGKCTDFDSQGSCCVYPNTYLLKVMGNATHNSKAFQVSSKIVDFTAYDCFIIRTADGSNWIWCGPSSTGDNREVAKSIGSLIGEYSLMIGGNESIEFWKYIPDSVRVKLKNANNNKLIRHDPDLKHAIEKNFYIDRSKAELYVVTVEATGKIKTKQIVSYTQQDLSSEDIYLLDARLFVYVWIGSLSPKMEKIKCWQIIDEYLANYPVPRDISTPHAVILQSLEPSTFIGYFDQWDKKFWDTHLTYDMERLNIEALSNGHITMPTTKLNKYVDNDFDSYPKYPVELLRSEASRLPDTIDPKMKELHLTHDDFVSIFHMNYSEYSGLPNWKKQELKKIQKLF
ncbi:villin-like protein quail isoform X1 [Contarinia nasturtii]|uniref:villin-like protein quail isoform X1 n=1 Tax=Contarinia nasturtii TaxID=265458 RepID=UPI0012D3AEE5|nr:villin-like protein quail isoform X1 [Contarinia nasturtii]